MAIASGWSDGGRDAGARRRDEVFPGLGAVVGVGVLAGLIAGFAIAEPMVRPAGHSLAMAAEGAALGGILGLFIGLGRGVVGRPGPAARTREAVRQPPAEAAPAAELWDPWLDHGRDLETVEPEVAIDESAQVPAPGREREAPILARAPVRPRVISPATGEAIPLEDEIGPMLQDGRGGVVVILGGPGSGRTTALRHLAAILPPWARGRVRLLEVLDLTEVATAGLDALVIVTMESNRAARSDYEKVLLGYTHPEMAAFATLLSLRKPLVYRLARWSQDDAIEYLLATDRDACASVMRRLKASGDLAFLDGIPELCAAVLDRMARDATIDDARAALRRELADGLESGPTRAEWLEDHCLARFRLPDSERPPAVAAGGPISERLARLTRHRPAAFLLAADHVAALIRLGQPTSKLAHRFDRDLVREVARTIAGDAEAIGHLSRWILSPKYRIHPFVASVLHAAMPGWRPGQVRPPSLEGAYLDGAVWPGQDLSRFRLRQADLREADLSGADLHGAQAEGACFQGADLRCADLHQWVATRADLSRANLSHVRARCGEFRGADLSGALLLEANLWGADLRGARIDEADFTRASLDDARLKGLPLCRARFDGARFGGADLSDCDMEGLVLNGPDFHDAKLENALLTGSRMPGGNFLGANLRGARLAEIDWPGACLRDAVLRGAGFHLGTTRSGLVGSPIAGEGSRTGFYTHDDLDRDVRPAEEIRKANLRGADLRGADIQGVDFYLVDLREARYTRAQAEHFRRCRAILDEPTA